MKKKYMMNQADMDKITEIARNPSVVIYLSGGIPVGPSTQERANAVWQEMGKRLGFVWDSAEDAGTGNPLDFLAEPTNGNDEK